MLGMFAKPHFTNVDNLTAVIRTDPEWVREVLPGPLVPTNPIVTVTLSQSDQFCGSIVGLQCAYDGIQGEFGLGYVMDSDLGVIFGREGLAEPKKFGDARITETDGLVIGTVARYGQELIRVEAEPLQAGDPAMVGDLNCFHFKYTIRPDGSGIDDVKLVCSSFANACTSVEILEPVSVAFTPSANDVYGEIPVLEVVACLRSRSDMVGSARYLADVDSEPLLPHAFFKHDDYRLTMPTD